MSRKSGVSNGLSREGPGVERQLPHHLKALCRCCGLQIRLSSVVGQFSDTDGAVFISHTIGLLLMISKFIITH
jgi:hypothetical protein